MGAGGGQCADLEDRAHPVSPHRRRLVLPARGRGHRLQRALVSQDVDGGVLLLPDGQARRSGAVRAGHLPGRRVLQLDGARACGLAQPFEGFWVQEKAGHGHCGRRDRRVANPLLQRPLHVGERCLRRDREAERHHPGCRFAASRRVAPLRVDARHYAEPRPLPRGCRPAARHVHACGQDVFVLDGHSERAQSQGDRRALQPDESQDGRREPDICGRSARVGLSHGLFHRRSPVREHRPVLRIRSGHHAADRRRRFPHRHLQRIAVRVGRRQHGSRPIPVPVFIRESRRRDVVPAEDLSRPRRSRAPVRSPDAVHFPPHRQPLAVLHVGDAVRHPEFAGQRATCRSTESGFEPPTACSAG